MDDQRIALFVCGVQKGGTTSMYGYLSDHPSLKASITKEPHFFDDETRDWTNPGYHDLHMCYPSDDPLPENGRLRFDSTPIYSFWPPSLARIRDYNPQAKLIFLLRDSFDRAWSHWCMEYARGADTLPFDRAIREGRERMLGLPELASERRVFSYVERGYYGEQVACALTLFARDQILFLTSKELAQDHASALARVSSFLQIAPFPECAPRLEHAQPAIVYPSQPTAADRALVQFELANDMAKFSELTGIRF